MQEVQTVRIKMKEMFKVEVVDRVMFQVVEKVVMMVWEAPAVEAVVVQEHLYMTVLVLVILSQLVAVLAVVVDH